LYTPENEHFGIVPVEAMHMGCIVLACNSGGPLESVANEKSGFLLPPNSEEWGKKILLIMNSPGELAETMKQNAKKRVASMFTFKVFA
jgi:alpha-1,3/alpha-1,6-mannosyltransferase